MSLLEGIIESPTNPLGVVEDIATDNNWAFERTGDSFVIELCDDGPEFDPTAATSLKSQAEDDDLPGGWGLELVRRNVDSIHYRREDGRNILRLIKRLVSASSDE